MSKLDPYWLVKNRNVRTSVEHKSHEGLEWHKGQLIMTIYLGWTIPLKAIVFTCECLQFSILQKVCVEGQCVCVCVAPCFVSVCQAWANGRIQTFNSQSDGSYISQSPPQTPPDHLKLFTDCLMHIAHETGKYFLDLASADFIQLPAQREVICLLFRYNLCQINAPQMACKNKLWFASCRLVKGLAERATSHVCAFTLVRTFSTVLAGCQGNSWSVNDALILWRPPQPFSLCYHNSHSSHGSLN